MTEDSHILFIGYPDEVRKYFIHLSKKYSSIGQLCASNAILNAQLKSKIQSQKPKGGDC